MFFRFVLIFLIWLDVEVIVSKTKTNRHMEKSNHDVENQPPVKAQAVTYSPLQNPGNLE